MLDDACLQILTTIVVMRDVKIIDLRICVYFNLSELLPFKYSYYTSVHFPDNKNLLCCPFYSYFLSR